MPTYEYSCLKCGPFEYFQKITDEALKVCPNCGSEVSRLISASAFHLKGSGWYKTDYSSSSPSTPSIESSTSSKPASETKDSAKPTENNTESLASKPEGQSNPS